MDRMKHITRAGGILLLSLFIMAGCSPRGTEDTGTLYSIVIALEPDKDPDRMLADQRALVDFIENVSDLPVDVIIPLSSGVIREGLRNGTVDVAFVNSTVAVRLADTDIASLLLATEIEGKPYYYSYWLALKDSSYESVEDLRGQPVAFSSRTSTSGYIIPVWDLHNGELINEQEGIEGFFGEGNVAFGIGYVSAVERVLQGQAEAAAVSYYVYEKDRHLSLEQRSRLKVVASQGPVPSHVLVARNALGEDAIQELRRVFNRLNEDAPDLRDSIFGAPLIEVEENEHFSTTRQALAVLGKIEG